MNKKLAAAVSSSGNMDSNANALSTPKQLGPDVVVAGDGVDITMTDSQAAVMLNEPIADTNSSHSSIPEDDNYCLRALQCACELREHKDSNLGTHIAVTAGKSIFTDD